MRGAGIVEARPREASAVARRQDSSGSVRWSELVQEPERVADAIVRRVCPYAWLLAPVWMELLRPVARVRYACCEAAELERPSEHVVDGGEQPAAQA
jgi:hypothetical protein